MNKLNDETMKELTGQTDKEYNESVIKTRLKYLRGEIEAERISYGEIAELQSLAKHIDKGDALLLEWAGVPEFSVKIGRV